MSNKRVCHSQSLRGEKLEAAIWADVSALLAEPHRIEEESAAYTFRTGPFDDSRARLDGEIDDFIQAFLRAKAAKVNKK